MIATIGSILVWILIVLFGAGVLLCAGIGFLILTSLPGWKR